MLKSYSSVFIKPNDGSGGNGIIRATRLRKGFEVRCGRMREVVGSVSLNKKIRSYQQPDKRYFVQRGLRLAEYKGSIFDARIYMQKPKSEWMIAGMTARVAAPKQYVTNHAKGGHAVPLHEALSTLFAKNRRRVNAHVHLITRLSSIIARTLNKRHSTRELGIDIGMEKNGHIWIFEANSKPGHKLFTQLPNKMMLHTIMRNKRLIRRTKS